MRKYRNKVKVIAMTTFLAVLDAEDREIGAATPHASQNLA